MLLPVAVAVKAVVWPNVVGLLLLADRPLMGVSRTVTMIPSGVGSTRPWASVTVRVKVNTVGVPGAVKVGWADGIVAQAYRRPPVCCQR